MSKQKSKGGSKVSKTSSGRRRVTRAKRVLMRIIMKIARWKRNQEDETKVSKWDKKQNVRLRSRHNKWNTEGLERHANLLREIIKRGRKVKAA